MYTGGFVQPGIALEELSPSRKKKRSLNGSIRETSVVEETEGRTGGNT
jgi:hypothetical protein